MYLDTVVGCFYIEDLEIGSSFTIDDLRISQAKYAWIKGVGNEKFITFSLKNIENGESSISIVFYNERIWLLSISNGHNYSYPPFTITEEERKVIKGKIELLGGESDYLWGVVKYSEDVRSGNVSIVVSYKGNIPPQWKR